MGHAILEAGRSRLADLIDLGLGRVQSADGHVSRSQAAAERVVEVDQVEGSADRVTDAPCHQRRTKAGNLIPPAELRGKLQLTDELAAVVHESRQSVTRILDGSDNRLLVIVGPCSIHDACAAFEYAQRLAELAMSLDDQLLIVMRTYFEKPRTRLGWKGFINDPRLDGSHDVNSGLHLARKLLLDILALGLPVGSELLDPFTLRYIADTITWGCIGARTCHSPVHRQLASGLPMPVGFKNPPDGNVQVAINAMISAAAPHVFMDIDDEGVSGLYVTTGNPDCHMILRGTDSGPNYAQANVADAVWRLTRERQREGVIIDVSHGNSDHDFMRQIFVAADITQRYACGEPGIIGVMLESFLDAGRQDLPLRSGQPLLTYGQSVTDACLDWNTTVSVLHQLAEAAECRRRMPAGQARR